MPDLAGAMMHAGFVEPVLDLECVRRDYLDVLALMRELKRLGAHNAASGRARGLTGRARLAAMTGAYEQRRTPAGLPATFQLLYGAAFKGTRDAGADTGVGKTRVTVGLLDALGGAGVRALGMKAVASGTDAVGCNEDVAQIE